MTAVTESGIGAEGWSGPGTGTGQGPAGTPRSEGDGPSQDWLSVTEAAQRAGVQERSIRRWIARGVVVSQVTPDGRRLVLSGSLPGQGQGHGPESGQGQDSREGPVTDSGPDSVRDQLGRERAMVEFLQGQLQQSRDAERELRLLLAQATKTAQLLATPPMLPTSSISGELPKKPRVRWWNLWRRKV